LLPRQVLELLYLSDRQQQTLVEISTSHDVVNRPGFAKFSCSFFDEVRCSAHLLFHWSKAFIHRSSLDSGT